MGYEFVVDERLGIPLPVLDREWDEYGEDDRAKILLRWEQIRGAIPDRIRDLERLIVDKQAELNRETDFPACCRLNTDIAELASVITDLHLWYRVHQDWSGKLHG